MQTNADEEIAKKLHESPQVGSDNLALRVNNLEGLAEQFEIQLDDVKQYNRQYIVNFKKL